MSNNTKGYMRVISYDENFSHCSEQVSFPTPFYVQYHSHLKRINIFFSVLNLYFSIIIGRLYYRFKSLFKHTLSGQSLGLLMFTKIYTWTMKTTNCPFPLRFHLRTAVLNVNQLNCGWLLSVLCEGGGGRSANNSIRGSFQSASQSFISPALALHSRIRIRKISHTDRHLNTVLYKGWRFPWKDRTRTKRFKTFDVIPFTTFD